MGAVWRSAGQCAEDGGREIGLTTSAIASCPGQQAVRRHGARVEVALKLIAEEPERIRQLWSNTKLALYELKRAGFDTGGSCTPIIPLYIRDDIKTFRLAKLLLEEGVFVNPITSPAVAKESSLIRLSLMATHTRLQIEEAVEKIYRLSKKLDII